nr:MAG: structural protein [Periparus ater ambidensovirus]
MSHRREPNPGVFGLIEPWIQKREKNLDFARRLNTKSVDPKWHYSESGQAGDAAYQQAREYYASINEPFPEDDPYGHELEVEEEKRGFVPPPFKYLGPGNSLQRGPAYNQIDADAQKHDEDYNKATNTQHIETADKEFIGRAGDHIIEGISGKGSISDTVGAIAGGIGIGAKHLVEKATGNLYPSISGILFNI